MDIVVVVVFVVVLAVVCGGAAALIVDSGSGRDGVLEYSEPLIIQKDKGHGIKATAVIVIDNSSCS